MAIPFTQRSSLTLLWILLICSLLRVGIIVQASSLLEEHSQKLSQFLEEHEQRLLQDEEGGSDSEDDNNYNGGEEEEEDNTVGGLYSTCSRRRNHRGVGTTCGQGLDCVSAPGGRYCYPMACLREAAEEIYVEQRLDLFVDSLLQRIGLRPESLFNDTTIFALRDNLLSGDDASEYIINGGGTTTQKIHTALQEDPSAVNAFRERAQACFPRTTTSESSNGGEGYEKQSGYTYYMGLHIELALGLKFVYQVGGAADAHGNLPDEGCYAHLCIGLGLDADAHLAPVLGVLGSGTISDIKFGAFMMDADLAIGIHFGGATGFTVPRQLFKAEFTGGFEHPKLGWGVGGGVSAYSCTASLPAPAQ